jgi:hypothetical protein
MSGTTASSARAVPQQSTMKAVNRRQYPRTWKAPIHAASLGTRQMPDSVPATDGRFAAFFLEAMRRVLPDQDVVLIAELC